MNLYRLSVMIDKKADALGLDSSEILIIKAAHRATGATYGECFLALVSHQWDMAKACRSICDQHETN